MTDTTDTLLICCIVMDCILALLAIWAFIWILRLRTGYDWQLQASEKANQNYRKYRQSLLELNKHLQDQLEAAEKKWGEADTQCKYHEREMELFLKKYQDLRDDYDTLKGQAELFQLAGIEAGKQVSLLSNQLKDIGEKYHQLQQDYSFLTTQSNVNGFPI